MAVAEQHVVGLAQRPQRAGELCVTLPNSANRRSRARIQVPIAAAIGNEIQRPVCIPLRLEHRLGGPAGNRRQFPQSILAELRDMQLGAIPGHVGMIPGNEGEPLAVGAQARVGDKITFTEQHFTRTPGGQCNPHDRVADILRVAVIFANADQRCGARGDHAIGVAISSRRNRDRLPVGSESVEPLISEIAVVELTARDNERCAAIFMYARPHIHALRADARSRRRRHGAEDSGNTPCSGNCFGPIQVPVDAADVADPDATAAELRRSQRRCPGAIGRNHGSRTGTAHSCHCQKSPTKSFHRLTSRIPAKIPLAQRICFTESPCRTRESLSLPELPRA